MTLSLRIERERDDRHPADMLAQLQAENDALRRELARVRADLAVMFQLHAESVENV